MKKSIAFITAGAGLLPMLAFAQNDTQILGILGIVQTVLGFIIPMLITLGIIYFIYGVIGYVSAKDEEKRGEARGAMIYGIIGLFVIVSIWGLIGFLGNATGVDQGNIDCLVDPTLDGC